MPGNIDDAEFIGSNNLIKHGAIPVTTPKDIVAYYYTRFPDVFDAAKVADYMRDQAASAELAKFHRRPEAMHVASAPSYAIKGKTSGRRDEKQSRSYDFGLFSMFSQKAKKNTGTQDAAASQPGKVSGSDEFGGRAAGKKVNGRAFAGAAKDRGGPGGKRAENRAY